MTPVTVTDRASGPTGIGTTGPRDAGMVGPMSSVGELDRIEATLSRVELVLWLNQAERAHQGIQYDLSGGAADCCRVGDAYDRMRSRASSRLR